MSHNVLPTYKTESHVLWRGLHAGTKTEKEIPLNTEQIETRLIPLDQVHPDPTQPRHLLPPDLTHALVTGVSLHKVLSQLRSRAERDKWIRERLAELDVLAGSIGADGLMQPIRVIRDGGERYTIEEGERRWWAHHILVQQGKEQFQNIAAFVLEKDSQSSDLLRRRIAENVLRSGFTAIELAKAMASRIHEIMTAEPGLTRSEAERRVGSENNMTDRRVRQYVALLTLSPEARELAQQAHLTESSMRPIVSMKDPANQLAAIRELLHPPHSKAASHSRPRLRQRHKSSPKSRRGSRDRKKALCILKSSSHNRPRVRNLRSVNSRIDAEKEAVRAIQGVLIIARSLMNKDRRKLKTASWVKVMKTEKDRRALSNLRDALDIALNIWNQTIEKE